MIKEYTIYTPILIATAPFELIYNSSKTEGTIIKIDKHFLVQEDIGGHSMDLCIIILLKKEKCMNHR